MLEKRGILIIAESMVHLQLSAFFNVVNANKYEDFFFRTYPAAIFISCS